MSDAQLLLIANTSAAWRWTQLHDAIISHTGCCPSTARRAISRGLQRGYLTRRGGSYQSVAVTGAAAAPSAYRRLDRHEMLRLLASQEVWRYTDMLAELRRELGTAETTLRTSLGYARDFGYLERVEGGWALTQTCRAQMALYGQLEGVEGFRFAAFLSGQPKRGFDRWS